MPYEFAVDPHELLGERFRQILNLGIPEEDITSTGERISEMWGDAPGTWVNEWSGLASDFAGRGDHLRASFAYGVAKFPVLAGTGRRRAFLNQLAEYLAAAPTFGLSFERTAFPVPHRDDSVTIHAHLFQGHGSPSDRPVLIASGGVDSWKMDLHHLFLGLARRCSLTVLAFDLPGTGETDVPLDDAADQVVLGIVSRARSLGNGAVGHLGLSFGGNFAAMTGLTGAVDASVVVGGPIALDLTHVRNRAEPLLDIVGNACGLAEPPTLPELQVAVDPLRRDGLLTTDRNSPMLVVNGAEDHVVPRSDTLTFTGRRDTSVELISGAGHCAVSKFGQVFGTMTAWLDTYLTEPSVRSGRSPAARS